MTEQISHNSYIEGPRWEDFQGFLMKLAMFCNVRVVINNETKSWIRKTTFYTVTGTREQVITFLRRVRESVEEYNEDRVM